MCEVWRNFGVSATPGREEEAETEIRTRHPQEWHRSRDIIQTRKNIPPLPESNHWKSPTCWTRRGCGGLRSILSSRVLSLSSMQIWRDRSGQGVGIASWEMSWGWRMHPSGEWYLVLKMQSQSVSCWQEISHLRVMRKERRRPWRCHKWRRTCLTLTDGGSPMGHNGWNTKYTSTTPGLSSNQKINFRSLVYVTDDKRKSM
jgi:hypothetical protein